jgi:FAD dependent oxidoreductase TIGR03364
VKVLVVGAGVLGTTHAWQAVRHGHEVLHVEREHEPRGATVRNFGLIWVSGRDTVELPAALRSRALWEELGTAVPGVGFRANGSLTVLRTEAELAVAKEAADRADAGDRGFRLLDAAETRTRNPALRGALLGALWCGQDATVESRTALPALRDHLHRSGRYTFLPGREIVDAGSGANGVRLRDDSGAEHRGDVAVLCPGAALHGLASALGGPLPVRPVRLQMLETEPLGETLPTAVADGDSMRYYPAFRGAALDTLAVVQPQPPVAHAHRMQLLCVQRLHGGLTIGDTHAYDEPFDFATDEAPYRHLVQTAEDLLGRPLPPIARRGAGVYAQHVVPGTLVHRAELDSGVWLVTGPGGRGMTLGPVLAEQSADIIGLGEAA